MKKKMLVMALALLAARVFAQQSFFIEPGTEIRSGQVTRGYCLEYTQPVLTPANIGNLTRITGQVIVTYKDGTVLPQTVADLLQNKLMGIFAYRSAQYVNITLHDSIEKISAGDDGIIMARQDADDTLLKANAAIITAARNSGMPHQAAQIAAWRNKIPEDIRDEAAKTISINYRNYTMTPPGQEYSNRYDGTPSIILENAARQYRFDGVKADSPEDKAIMDFITHFDSDHIDFRELKALYDQGLRNPVFYPLPMRDKSMQNRAFKTMQEIVDTGDYRFDIQDYVCQLLPQDMEGMTPVINSVIGQFLYSKYQFGEMTIETYKHINPSNNNMDGLVYRVAHKNITRLIPGDFDNEKALLELLEQSETNMKKRAEIGEEIYRLEGEIYNAENLYERNSKKTRRNELVEARGLLPVVEADILKWPHHAHIFRNRELGERLNAVVNPRYIMYQAHPLQEKDPLKPENFEAMIQGYDFKDKFVNTAEYKVNIISLYFLKRSDVPALFNPARRDWS
jgi:hypothetical protein